MFLISLFVLAAGGWIYTAATFQIYGDTWAVNTCTGFPGICDYSNSVLGGAIFLVITLYVARAAIDS
jgi:hypothetical protein